MASDATTDGNFGSLTPEHFCIVVVKRTSHKRDKDFKVSCMGMPEGRLGLNTALAGIHDI